MKRSLSFLFSVALVCWLIPVQSAHCGLGSYKSRTPQTLRYDVSGEAMVKPDCALFPISLSAEAKSYQAGMTQAKGIFDELRKALKGQCGDKAAFYPASLDESRSYEKKRISVSFFKSEEKNVSVRFEFILKLGFDAEAGFWERAAAIAKALDFLNERVENSEAEPSIRLRYGEMRLEVEKREQYREAIVRAIYAKAKKVADVIAEQEKRQPVIQEIHFSQAIRQDILNLHQAALSLEADIAFGFVSSPEAEQSR